MKNLEAIRTRYLKESFSMKLGHLASDLARISSFSENSMNIRAIEDILEESKFFAEWAAPEAPFQVQVLLSEMQPELALWQLHLQRQKGNAVKIEEWKEKTKVWSSQLIEASGILAAS